MRVGVPVRIADGSTVPVGDALAADGSLTGMRLPTRYSFSSIGFCAVDVVFVSFEVLAHPAMATAAATAR